MSSTDPAPGREAYELSMEPFYEDLLGKGLGDPDKYGYPGEGEAT